jgi:hypothetical protein
MMVRTQIMLDAEEHRRAKDRARELGISLAEYVRRVVANDLGDARPRVDAAAIVGLFGSGGSDIARHKGEYLADALGVKFGAAGVTKAKQV